MKEYCKDERVYVNDHGVKKFGKIMEIDDSDCDAFYLINYDGKDKVWFDKNGISNIDNNLKIIESEGIMTTTFKEGNKVISDDSTMGEGVVREIRVDTIVVDFKNGYTGACYDLSGKRELEVYGSDTIKLMEEDMTKFKVGDKIQLKKDFYTIPYFKEMSRFCRKYIAGLKDKTITITNTEKDDGFCDIFISGYTSLRGSCDSTWTNSCMFELITEVKEVERPAQAGEYIKIVDRGFTYSDYYIVDDICEVVKREDNNPPKGVYAKTRGTHPCNCGDNTSYIFDTEYVVLENYKPETFSVNSDEIEAKSFEKKEKENKLINEKFGFKIGEEVMYRGEKHTILAFDKTDDNYLYLSYDNQGCSKMNPSYNDRPLPDFWYYDCFDKISHIIKPEVGMYARVMTTVNVMDDGDTISLSPYKTGDVFKINSIYHDEQWLTSDDHPSIGVKLTSCELLPDYNPIHEDIVKENTGIKPEIGMYIKILNYDGMYDVNIGQVYQITEISGDSVWVKTSEKEDAYIKEGFYKLVPNYLPLRTWTEEEIIEAKCIIAEEIMANIGKDIVLAELEDKNFSVRIFNENTWETKIRTSKKCVTDEYNKYIGAMVAICRATDRVLPTWINKR